MSKVIVMLFHIKSVRNAFEKHAICLWQDKKDAMFGRLGQHQDVRDGWERTNIMSHLSSLLSHSALYSLRQTRMKKKKNMHFLTLKTRRIVCTKLAFTDPQK